MYAFMSLLRMVGGRFTLPILVVVALAVPLWLWGPKLVIDGTRPLEPIWVRVAIIAALLVLILLVRNFSAIRLRLQKIRLTRRGYAGEDGLGFDTGAVEERLSVMERFETTMETLGGGAQSPAIALKAYDTPWYLMLGPQGAGKSTLLTRAELDWPLHQPAVGGPGGEDPCDIWVSKSAVLVDAAGRIAVDAHQSDRDQSAWRTLLQMLSYYRPRRPINAILVALPVELVLDGDDERRRRQAEALRRRIQEASSQFGMRLPVYLIVTKCDLLAGFSEFFDASPIDERSQSWGFALPVQRNEASEALTRHIEGEIALLAERVEARIAPRLHQERDPARRCLVSGFGLQFRLFQAELSKFAGEFLTSSRNDPTPALRGIYLTSATREGADPEQLFGLVAPPFELDASRVPAPLHPERSFFLAELFRQNILPESNLVGANRKIERGLAWRHLALYGVAALLFLAVCGVWTYGYNHDRARLSDIERHAQQSAVGLQQAATNPDLAAVFPVLSELDAAGSVYGEARWLPQLLNAGLALDPRIGRQIDIDGKALLQAQFQPRVAYLARNQLAEQLRAGADAPTVRQALRIYLMLCTPSHADAEQLRTWAAQQSQSKFALFPEQGKLFQARMKDLLATGLVPLPYDLVVVDQARRQLLRTTPAAQLYEDLKRRAAYVKVPDFRLSDLRAQSSSRPVFGTDYITSPVVVPGLYTADGFYSVFLKYLPSLNTSSTDDGWMFDTSSMLVAAASNDQLITQVSDLYVRDYIGAWSALLSSIRFYNFRSIEDATQTLDELASADSQMKGLLQALKRNTDLPPPLPPQSQASALPPGAPASAAQPAPEANPIANDIARAMGANVAPQGLPPQITGTAWPGTQIAKGFQTLTSLVDDGNARQQPIDTVLNAVASLSAYIKAIALAPDPSLAAYKTAADRIGARQGQSQDALTAVRLLAERQPDPVRRWLATLAGESWAIVMETARGAVDQAWQRQVVPEWRRTLLDRYPLFKGAGQDASLKDFGSFFGPGGTIEKFVQDTLTPFVNTSGPRWANTQIEGQSLGLSAEMLRQLQLATSIRAAFFPDSTGTSPLIRFTIRPTLLDARATQIQLQLEGNTLVYRHEPPRVRKLQWPGDTAGGQLRVVVTDLQNRTWSVDKDGVWAMFRLFEDSQFRSTASGDRFLLDLTINDIAASFDLKSDSAAVNPFDIQLLHDFRLPDRVM